VTGEGNHGYVFKVAAKNSHIGNYLVAVKIGSRGTSLDSARLYTSSKFWERKKGSFNTCLLN